MTGPYTDHHVHFLATVAARVSVDVSEAANLDQLADLIRAEAPERGWVRAWGYEEWRLDERRHPTREDLDRTVPGRPVVLHHRTGHVAVLNSAALAEIGPVGGDDGLVVDRHDILARVPRLEPAALRTSAAAVSAEWERAGVGAFVDATHTNGPDELLLLDEWHRLGLIRQEVTAMVGADGLGAGTVPRYGEHVGAVRVGAVKLMPRPAARPARDAYEHLGTAVAAAHKAGFPVAVHVVDIDALDATLDALAGSAAPGGTADRIEHNALCLPEQVERIAAIGATVVVNPSFLLHRREKYEAELAPIERSWLIRMGTLLRAGITVRAGSDSPVTPCRPDQMLAAAQAHPFGPDESLNGPTAAALLSPLLN